MNKEIVYLIRQGGAQYPVDQPERKLVHGAAVDFIEDRMTRKGGGTHSIQ